jgi:hypothetical protein
MNFCQERDFDLSFCRERDFQANKTFSQKKTERGTKNGGRQREKKMAIDQKMGGDPGMHWQIIGTCPKLNKSLCPFFVGKAVTPGP